MSEIFFLLFRDDIFIFSRFDAKRILRFNNFPIVPSLKWNNFRWYKASESKSTWLSPRRAYQRSSCSFPSRRFCSPNLPSMCRGILRRASGSVSSNVQQLDLYNLSVLPAVSRSAYHLIKRGPVSTFVTHISSGRGAHTALMHRHFEYFIPSSFLVLCIFNVF